jgi:diguanylate cyclase (GGDEF)-like protein/PAS domain S-box-containing protein
MTLHNQAKSLIRYQSIGIICIVLFIVAGIFSYFLFKDNYTYKNRLEALSEQIQLEHKQKIQLEVQNAKEYISFKNSQAEGQLMQQAKAAVEQAYSIANGIYQQKKADTSDELIKDLIIAALRDLRFFNGRGYYFIDELDSLVIMLPPFPHLEGTRFLDNPKTVESMTSILESIENEKKSGFSKYKWYKPNDHKNKITKVSYSKVFEPFGWLIGTGDYIASFEGDLRAAALERFTALKLNNQTNITILNANAKVIAHSQPSSDLLTEDYQLDASLMHDILVFAKNGGGFTNFSQLPHQDKDLYNRLAYVETIEPFDWVVIADVPPGKVNSVIETQKQQIEQQSLNDLKVLIIVLAVTLFITLILVYIYTVWFKRLFSNYQTDLDCQQHEISLNTKELKLASSVFESSNDAIIITNTNQEIIAANPACTRTTGFESNEIIGKNPRFLNSDHQDDFFHSAMQAQLEQQGYWQGEVWNQHKNGSFYPIWLSVSTSLDNKRNILNYISIFADISERKKTEQRLSYLADYDPLTKLAKHHLIAKRVDKLVAKQPDTEQKKFALMLIDLDRFKNINDSLGHNIGDKVLQRIAERLSTNIRASDLISRLSGDEFIILVNHNKAETASARLAYRILRDLSEPLNVLNHDLVVTPSIGIATYPENGDDFDSLLKNADSALNHAKAHGRNNFKFFTSDMHHRASQKLTLERGLRSALDKEQFEVYYQAQFNLQTGLLEGCEALLRWHCPELNTPCPDEFIPVAEETGLILPIGQWVLDHACLQATQWQEQGYDPIPIAVNVSSYQFNKDIIKSIKSSLRKAKLEPQWLVVEITESALMKDPEFTKDALQQLRALGIKIALDDFGTGYSSLAYLKRFPIDKLKIDRAFIMGLPADQDDLVITRSIIDVASNLNMTTIAEGVETQEQQLLLRDLGCHHMQGFLKAKPVNAEQFAAQHLL